VNQWRARVLLDGPPILRAGAFEIELVKELHLRARGERFRQVRIELQCLVDRGARLRHDLPRRADASGELDVGVGETRVREREPRVLRDRAAEVLLGFGERLRSESQERDPPLQVQLVGLGVHGSLPRELRALLRRDLHADLPGDRARDVTLDREDVAQLPVVAFRPHLAFRRIDQPGVDADVVARPEHRPLDDRVHVEVPRDLRKRLLRSLVAHGRGPRDHAERRDLGKARDELVRHPVGEVFLRRILRQVLERQDRE